MYVGLYVPANRDQQQFAEQNPYERDSEVGPFRWLLGLLSRLFKS